MEVESQGPTQAEISKKIRELSIVVTDAEREGDCTTALSALSSLLDIYRQVRSQKGEFQTKRKMADVSDKFGLYDEAYRHLSDMITMSERWGDSEQQARGLMRRAVFLKTRSKEIQERNPGASWASVLAVRTDFERALSILQFLSNPLLKGECHGYLALLYSGQQQYDLAIPHFAQGISIYKALGQRQNELTLSLEQARTVYQQGQHSDAIRLCQGCVRLAQDLGNKKLEGVALFNFAIYCHAFGWPHEAIDACERSLDIAEDLQNDQQVAACKKLLKKLRNAVDREQKEAQQAMQEDEEGMNAHDNGSVGDSAQAENGDTNKTESSDDADKTKRGGCQCGCPQS